MKRPANVVHVDGVTRFLPEEPPVIGADDQTVRFDVERVELRPRFRLRSVHVPRIDLARELLREPAHGGLQLRADRSAGEVVIGHNDVRGLAGRRLGSRFLR